MVPGRHSARAVWQSLGARELWTGTSSSSFSGQRPRNIGVASRLGALDTSWKPEVQPTGTKRREFLQTSTSASSCLTSGRQDQIHHLHSTATGGARHEERRPYEKIDSRTDMITMTNVSSQQKRAFENGSDTKRPVKQAGQTIQQVIGASFFHASAPYITAPYITPSKITAGTVSRTVNHFPTAASNYFGAYQVPMCSCLFRSFSTNKSPARMNKDPQQSETPVLDETFGNNGNNGDPNAKTINPVTRDQLWSVFIASAIPFVGFGFLDNFLMILAGDMIDATLCVAFGFSTMAAAALGNTFSDIAGVFSGGIVEDIAEKWFGIEMPPLDQDQLKVFAVKLYQYVGQAVGIIIGCFFGMCPLLWIDPDANEKKKKEKERNEVLASVVSEVSDLLNAEATIMMMLDKDKGELYTKATEMIPEFRSPMDEGIMGHVATTGKFISIKDVRDSEFFDHKRHLNYRGTGMDIRSVLVMPVLSIEDDEDYPVMAVVEVINKKSDAGFTGKDEEILAAICSHITVSLTDDQAKSFKNVIEMCRNQIRNRQQYSTMNPVIEQRQLKLFETLMEETSSILKCGHSQLLLIDPVQNKLKCKVAHRIPLREYDMEDEDVCQSVCQTGQLINIQDFSRSRFYQKSQSDEYLGKMGDPIRTRLCVPIINTEHHVIGCLEAINKKSNESFTTEDIEIFMNIASHVALTLEGEGSSIKKMIALANDQREMMQQSTDFVRTKTLQQGGAAGRLQVDIEEEGVDEEWDELEMDDDSEDIAGGSVVAAKTSVDRRVQLRKLVEDMDLVITLDRAIQLPIADYIGTIDPYITISIVQGDPTSARYDGPTKGRGVESPLGSAQSSMIRQDQNPRWNREKIKIPLPKELENGYDNVYVHVKMWDWDPPGFSHDLVGQMVYPLKRVINEEAMDLTGFNLTQIRANQPDGTTYEYDLKRSKLFLRFSIGRKDKQVQKNDLMSRARKQQAERHVYESQNEV